MTLWTVARQAPLSMGFSRQEYWSGLPYPPPGDLPNPGIEPESPALHQRQIPYNITYMWNKYDTKELVYKAENRVTDIENRLVVAKEEGWSRMD